MITLRRSTGALLGGSFAVLLLSVCIGPIAHAASKQPTTTTRATPTTTRPAAGVTDPSSDALAMKGALVLADLGPGWKLYEQKKATFVAGTRESCSYRQGSPLAIADRSYRTPHYTDGRAFVETRTWVFVREADAKAFTAFWRTPDFLKCVEQDHAADQKRSGPKNSARLVESDGRNLSSDWGIEAFHRIALLAPDSNGDLVEAGQVIRQTIRRGRLVTVLTIETPSARTDAEASAMTKSFYKISSNLLSAMYKLS